MSWISRTGSRRVERPGSIFEPPTDEPADEQVPGWCRRRCGPTPTTVAAVRCPVAARRLAVPGGGCPPGGQFTAGIPAAGRPVWLPGSAWLVVAAVEPAMVTRRACPGPVRLH